MASEWKGFTPFQPLPVFHKLVDYNLDSDIWKEIVSMKTKNVFMFRKKEV